MIWDKINEVAKELREQGYNVREIKSMMGNAVDCAINDLIKKEFTMVIFDSPEGANSKRILEEEGYASDWFGHPGCRGETKVYLPKSKDIEEFKEWMKDVELVDNYSVITVK